MKKKNNHPLKHLNHLDFLYIPKLNYIKKFVSKIEGVNILELGVMHGRSTKMFLDICKKNRGHLTSIDIDNYSDLYNDSNWTFIHSSDDNFDFIKRKIDIKKKFDVIYIDSLHHPDHVKKVLYFYYKYLKINGRVFIDDINWLPYVKNSFKDSEYSETINRKTFNKIIEIYYRNLENIELEFNFSGTGNANIKKLTDSSLNEPLKIRNRLFGFRNFLRLFIRRNPKK